jgi:hypothetical protein
VNENLVLDPGFETGVPWTLTGDASLYPGEGYGGSQALLLVSGQLPILDPEGGLTWGRYYTGKALQTLPVKAGHIYPVVFYHRQQDPVAGSLYCIEQTSGGTVIVIDEVQWPDAATDWTIESFLWTPTEDDAQFGFYGPPVAGIFPHYFFVDDAEVLMPRGLQVVYAALFNRLKTLNGAPGGYNYTLASRVIPRLVLPDEPGAPVMPYVCLPLSDNGPFLEQGERALRVALRQQIVAFLPESVDDTMANSAAYQALLIQSDLQRCLWPASGGVWDLGDASVEDVQFVTKETTAGQNDGIPFSEISITVDVITRYSREDLSV